ncbi:MAG: hypothetical protein Q7U48_15415 [Hydrogenophaga sp.]|nr:hypothetical protein [Hydrogenophaga sp.]
MHMKKRGARAMLYRSTWVPKGADGNTHGYSKQQYLGSLDLKVEELPLALKDRLTEGEVDYVMAKVIDPARRAAVSLAQQEVARQKDPLWRIDDALRLVKEASALSACALVPDSRVESLRGELQKVRTVQWASARPVPPPDPLSDALAALRRAASAVRDGRYGDAPKEGVRGSSTYQTWVQIYREIEGSAGPVSLLRALQGRGFAKAKAR